ncbi:class I SAM-dependent methyltransferase [Haliea sp. E17]|uniref:class I SAM-dependent methyltransferase n=1 Tax=Haliea sp. E17 TaxID=3401576 RepID=UPI003AAFC8B9
MARQPKLILRESAIDDVVAAWQPGSFLETGAGTGYMTRKFLERGYHGACYELSQTAREGIRRNLASYPERIQVLDSLQELGTTTFDYLLTFEVLEHIEDDRAALQQWAQYLRPGGKILLSVPAHQRKFGPSDTVVGHLRRYERQQLRRLLESTGFTDIQMINYGFPITEMTRKLGDRIVRNEAASNEESAAERSQRSSYSRGSTARKLIRASGEAPFLPFKSLQRSFYSRDWGDGIIAHATLAGR